MKLRLLTIACALTLVAATYVAAQTRPSNQRPQQPNQADRGSQSSPQFDDHARQTARDWYAKNQSHPPAGFRPQDRLTADQESRLQPGKPLDRDLRSRTHAVPRDLARQLPPPPPQHRYVAVGGHVGLVDSVNNILRDVIHVHNP